MHIAIRVSVGNSYDPSNRGEGLVLVVWSLISGIAGLRRDDMRISIVSVVAAALLFLGGCAQKGEIVIGGLFPLSGNAATFGQSSKQGMQLAVDEFNNKGGIAIGGLKMPVRAVYEDTEGAPEKSADAAQKLISQNGVAAIVGAVMSKNSLAIAPICQSSQVPMITPASTNVKRAL